MKLLPRSNWPSGSTESNLPVKVRLAVNLLSLVAITVALIGWLGDLGSLRAAGVLCFALVGLGAGPMSQVKQISTLSFFSASVGLSVVTFVVIGFAMVETKVWAPEAVFVVLAVASCGLHALSVRRYRSAPADE